MLWFLAPAFAGLPPIQDVDFGPGCRGVPERAEGVDGNRLTRVWIDEDADPRRYPDARCNDGTTPAYYVRPGVGDDADRWLVHFEGGEGCYDWRTCADRWCGRGFYERDKMTSDGSPETIRGHAALSPDADANPLAGWTHVYVPYCSSDFWVGRNDAAAAVDGALPGQEFTLVFRGAAIAQAVVGELADRPPVHEDLGLPPLADATQIVLSGGSAGALGLGLAADALSAGLAVAAPGADVRAVIDSYFPPNGETRGGGPYSGSFAVEAEAEVRGFADGPAGPAFWDAGADASCLADHPDDGWKCLDTVHVLMNHTHTPFFVYQDQGDPVVCGDECARGVREQVAALADIGVDGPHREGPPTYLSPIAPGWFAPRCRVHQALATNADGGERYLRQAIPLGRADDPPFDTFAGVLSAWLDDRDPTRAIRRTGRPHCPTARE